MFEKSKRTLTGRSGTYKLQQDGDTNGSSSAKKKKQSHSKTLNITVHFLDDSRHSFELEKSAKGSAILDRVFLHLELIERDYFGLQFDELLRPVDVVHELSSPHLRWVESSKQLRKQIRFNKPDVKDSTAQDSYTATLYFRVKFFAEDPAKLNEEYTRYHFYLQVKRDVGEGRLHPTTSTSCLLSSYTAQSELGDFNPPDHDPTGHYLNPILQHSSPAKYLTKISQLHKLHAGQSPADAEFNYLDCARRIEGYGVTFHKVKDNSGKEISIGVCCNGVSVHSNGVKMNTFSWGKITKIAFKRKEFYVQLRGEKSEPYSTLLMFDCWSYRSCKRLWKSCVEHHAFFRLSAPPAVTRRPALMLLTLGSRFRYSGRTEYQTREDSTTTSTRRNFFRSKFLRQTNKLDVAMETGAATTPSNLSRNTAHAHAHGASDKVHQSYAGEKIPRVAWAVGESAKKENGILEGGFLDNKVNVVQHQPQVYHTTRGIAFADDESQKDDELSGAEDGTVTIPLHPDPHGKFGFNVKGGCDMGCPVLVSRVAPGTPADRSYPRVTEGDHLIQINGKDTLTMAHREVVNSIRQSAIGQKFLLLRVRQNVYTTDPYENLDEEPSFQYVPEIRTTIMPSSDQSQLLSSSMLLLSEAMETDSIVNQFEMVFRRKAGMECKVAKEIKNVEKNRYRDISPYDSTRVILQTSPTGDYINANYVTMEIPVSGVVNRYIACQGPLSTTTQDFWTMAWETQSPLIVMLTPICERGRIKCHPYWPTHLNSSVVFNSVKVTLVHETIKQHWIERDFELVNLASGEKRAIEHLQFQAWPDHGVPCDEGAFVRFVGKVRTSKLGQIHPTIIHCSAGIGRTGVLILMETAECLIESNQPVYPLDILAQMRVQRPMMIQTGSQYRFVCQSVLKVYEQGIIRPLPEFAQQSLVGWMK